VTEEAARLALEQGANGVHDSLDRRAREYRAATRP
jgi:hypothetical protein